MINHSPICSCPPNLIGDPFVQCTQPPPSPEEGDELQPQNPCIPSPCGNFAECRPIGERATCNCLPNYIGSPPNCRPECVVNSDCPSDKSCIAERCRNPCDGSCGLNSGKYVHYILLLNKIYESKTNTIIFTFCLFHRVSHSKPYTHLYVSTSFYW